MSPFKKLHIVLSLLLVPTGVVIVVTDLIFITHYGINFNEAAFFLGNGEFVDWPTGERPLYAYFPLAAYRLAAWLLAILLLSLWPEVKSYPSRTLRGTE
jgi:hypothetical protein